MISGYINKHMQMHQAKFNDQKYSKKNLNAGSIYMLKFEVKSGYHHIDVNASDSCLGFLQKIDAKIKHFAFTVFPLETLSTKVVPLLVKILVQTSYRDSTSLGRWPELTILLLRSNFLSGFVVNFEKQVWEPQEVMPSSE